MSEPKQLQNHSMECLRLEADCRRWHGMFRVPYCGCISFGWASSGLLWRVQDRARVPASASRRLQRQRYDKLRACRARRSDRRRYCALAGPARTHAAVAAGGPSRFLPIATTRIRRSPSGVRRCSARACSSDPFSQVSRAVLSSSSTGMNLGWVADAVASVVRNE